ncbi:peptidoglycan endopeptidase [Macrococcoides caseolyticum subsp. hominis]|uniref:C40 family peptidase n=1 Tax=Macrococcoides caseolyticum TaxID=69966 RepID=UPI000C145424|nr:C40 family peptidase [Macrococcus caseolyticus]RAI83187.1 peptidoglycan endopeptidase [Macrococcus caseolyticus subsp. hominis]
MKKTALTLTTLATLSTLGTAQADAAAYGRTDVTQTSSSVSSIDSSAYDYTYNNDGSYTYTYNAPTSVVAQTATQTAPVVSQTSTTTEVKKAPATTAVSGNVASVALSVAAGKSYVYGANSASAVDCSSFAQQVLAAMGKSIPRTTYAQAAVGTQVSAPQPGDLVFFNNYSHVGVYIGGGQMVDALNPSEGVGQRAVSYVSGHVDGYYRF